MSQKPLVKPSPPKFSSIYPVLWSFASERHCIYMRRVAGNPWPWTTNPVFLNYKFTNSYRATDRVSQYLIRLLYSDPSASGDTILLRTLLFKMFNRIETWQEIVSRLGLPIADNFSYSMCERILDDMRSAGRRIYSGAYIMPSGGRRFARKHQMHLQLIRQMLNDGLASKLSKSKSLSEAYELLLAYPTLGPFLAFQYVIDLNYSTLMSHNWSDRRASPSAPDRTGPWRLSNRCASIASRWATKASEARYNCIAPMVSKSTPSNSPKALRSRSQACVARSEAG